jgi:hypothetical protein
MRQSVPRPKSVREAVEWLAVHLPEDTLHLIRGATQSDLILMHFGLGAWIRNELGLWNEPSELLQDCGTNHADSASTIILNALWEHLVRSATADELSRSREIRAAYDAGRERKRQQQMDGEAAKDAAITEKRCPYCGKPCPSYRKTCKYCGKAVVGLR